MNIGTINQIFTGEMVVDYTYTTEHGKQVKQQLPVHPFYKNYHWELNQQVQFQYAMECENHYPKTCTCERVVLYALPVMTKERRGLLKRIVAYFQKNK